MEYVVGSPKLVDSCYNRGLITLIDEDASTGRYPEAAGLVCHVNAEDIEVKNCYNAGDVKMVTEESTVGIRYGSLVSYLRRGDLLKNNFCYISEGMKNVGVVVNETEITSEEIIGYESKEDMKKIAKKLGDNFKEDTSGRNDGYPILTWQE